MVNKIDTQSDHRRLVKQTFLQKKHERQVDQKWEFYKKTDKFSK